jgi:hypothetical protein
MSDTELKQKEVNSKALQSCNTIRRAERGGLEVPASSPPMPAFAGVDRCGQP